ncbi:MAG: pyrimidine dimer DNA glycosylase/endonuclease V [Actinomycetota bacterium]|nr:pyrimidine dimer DNA glycosylase/endonuclease V [Actinomycetota bacterium]
MRIWDRVPPESLCRKHLLGEHRELHGLWNILLRVESGEDPRQVGYAGHPETKRWFGHGPALWNRHEMLATEMTSRGYNHQSPLKEGESGCPLAGDAGLPDALDDQLAALAAKDCDCDTGR